MIKYILIAVLLFIKVAYAESDHIRFDKLGKQALECTSVLSRAERLACFDDVFSSTQSKKPDVIEAHHSEPWLRAMDSENKRQNQIGWLRNELKDAESQSALWFTVSAASRESKPTDIILMASCVNNISRLELILPTPQKGARAELSLGSQRQMWTYDEQGIVLRSGRGLDAIRLMRPLIHKDHIILRSNVSELDGTVFKTPNGKHSFSELRELCRW